MVAMKRTMVGDKVTKGRDCVGLRRKLLIMDGENNIVDRGEKAV